MSLIGVHLVLTWILMSEVRVEQCHQGQCTPSTRPPVQRIVNTFPSAPACEQVRGPMQREAGASQQLVQEMVAAKTPQTFLRTQVSVQCRETDSPTTGEQVR
jgi:hypothetical protein